LCIAEKKKAAKLRRLSFIRGGESIRPSSAAVATSQKGQRLPLAYWGVQHPQRPGTGAGPSGGSVPCKMKPAEMPLELINNASLVNTFSVPPGLMKAATPRFEEL
jgi:hypothetical protein